MGNFLALLRIRRFLLMAPKSHRISKQCTDSPLMNSIHTCSITAYRTIFATKLLESLTLLKIRLSLRSPTNRAASHTQSTRRSWRLSKFWTRTLLLCPSSLRVLVLIDATHTRCSFLREIKAKNSSLPRTRFRLRLFFNF